MRRLRRVVWSKGMFLTPQHFQAQDNFHEEAMHFRFAASQFANWGVTHLEVDGEALTNGVFTLRVCRGLLRDGLAFSIPESDELPPGRTIAEYFAPTQESLDVYLGIPERRPQGRNYTRLAALPPTADLRGASTRFVAENVEVIDESGDDEQKTVQVAQKNFRLLFAGQNLDGYSHLRIARVVRNSVGSYALDPQFIAPCLSIASSEHLMSMLRRQIEILASKSSSLAAGRRQRGAGLAEFNVSDTGSFWLLHTINSNLPELRHDWSVRHGHPEALFVSLLRLAGALSTFSLDPKARDFPDYSHDELGFCFSALEAKIQGLLETVIPSKVIPVPLRLVDNNVWSGTVVNGEHFRNSQFFLAVSSQMGVDDLIRKVSQLVKITAADEIANHIRLALPGVTVRHAPSPPPAIPFKLENQYFSLNQSGRLWDRIVQSRNLSVFAPPDITDPKMELLIVLQ